MRKADDRAVADRDERVEPGIGAFGVQSGNDVVGRQARNPLVRKRAGVQEVTERDGVGVRSRTRFESSDMRILSRGARPRGADQRPGAARRPGMGGIETASFRSGSDAAPYRFAARGHP